jgi:hypothetical protein
MKYFYELFFNPEYKFFEAMRWREDKNQCVIKNCKECFIPNYDEYCKEEWCKEWRNKSLYHRLNCIGKTAEEIIKYVEENTEWKK